MTLTNRGQNTGTAPHLSLLCRDATAVLRSDPNPRMRSSSSLLRPPSPGAGDDAPSGGRPPSFHHCSALDGGSDLRGQQNDRRHRGEAQ